MYDNGFSHAQVANPVYNYSHAPVATANANSLVSMQPSNVWYSDNSMGNAGASQSFQSSGEGVVTDSLIHPHKLMAHHEGRPH